VDALVRRPQRAILVLDGFELMQVQDGDHDGTIRNHDLRELLERIADTGPLPKPSSSKITFSVAEVAEMTGLSPNTIRKTIQVGKLKAVRLGSRVLVTQKALEEWLEAGSTR